MAAPLSTRSGGRVTKGDSGSASRESGPVRRRVTPVRADAAFGGPVLGVPAPGGFGLWPVAGTTPSRFLPLGGALPSAEVGTAVMAIAGCKDIDPDGDRPPRPATAPARSSTDCSPSTTSSRPAARGSPSTPRRHLRARLLRRLEDWRDWYAADHGGLLGFGHVPASPVTERLRRHAPAHRRRGAERQSRALAPPELRRPPNSSTDHAGFLTLSGLSAPHDLPAVAPGNNNSRPCSRIATAERHNRHAASTRLSPRIVEFRPDGMPGR